VGLLDEAVDGPLRIDTVPLPDGGTLGLLHCPGRSGTDGAGRRWARSLAADLAALDAWGADALLSLVEPAEFARLGVPQLPDVMAQHRIQWLHVPVTDMGTPDAASRAAWAQAGPAIDALLARGGRLAIHCAAGLGRTGTIAAALLVRTGVEPDDAIARIRAARPGTLETAAQEAFVRTGLPTG
jgi:ADP-ribosyl-[dinitrogen reductase] hydrolase